MTAQSTSESAPDQTTPSHLSDAAPWSATADGHQRSLRSKLVLSLAAMCAVFLVIDEAVRLIVIQPAFEELEYASAMRDTNRVMSAIKVESEHLRSIAEQGASRIISAQLADTDAEDLQASFWNRESLHFDTVQWAAIVGEDASWRWITPHDQLSADTRAASNVEALRSSILHRISQSDSLASDGLTRDNNRNIFAYASIPIATKDIGLLGNATHGESNPTESDSQAPKLSGDRYHVVVGKQMNDSMIAELRRRTQVTFSIQVYHQKKFDETIQTWAADESTLVVEVPLIQNEKQTLANLFVQVPRDVVQQAKNTTALARNVFVCGAALTLVLMLLQLQRIVIGPLKRIREHTDRIAETGLDAQPLELTSNDEIGALAMAFDNMKMRLADTHKRLADASHAAGMSQVADTVIHNVGNVLTNVNSLIETASDRVEGLRVAPLNKLATRLRQGENRDVVIAATPDYLQRLSAELESDQSELAELLQTLHDNVQHIHCVIRDQRQHTLKSVESKRFSMQAIIDEAVGCCEAKLHQDKIAVQFSPGSDCVVESDRSLLLQIVINLIGNARNAMVESNCEEPVLSISLSQQDETISLAISDRGCGMSDETLGKVFNAHFTTRAAGTGLGLHFCAITLKRLGGRIKAQSEGLGMGSTFTIELPAATSQIDHDAEESDVFFIDETLPNTNAIPVSIL
jgi:signal transduction histidine kinase